MSNRFFETLQILKRHGLAGLVSTLFLLVASIYSIATPIFESLDELWHYPFVWHLARNWELPVQDPANVQLWRQEGSQPPLYYALAALLTAPIPTDDLPGLIYRNPHADLGLVTTDGNINMIVHTAQESWPWREAVLAVHMVRFFSVLLGLGTILTVYAIGRTLWPERPAFALLAMSFVAFNPMFLFVSGSVNNDNLVTLLASLVLWRLVVLILHGNEQPPPWNFALLGILVGLASLSKFSGIGLLGLVGLSLLWCGWRSRSWQTAILGNSIVTILTAAISGWWYWRNVVLYDDWTGTRTMVDMMGVRAVTPTVGQLLAEVPGTMRSFWGLFGGLSLPMPPPVYWLLNLLLVAGLGGLVMVLPAKWAGLLPPKFRSIWFLLAGWVLLMAIGLIQWTLRTPASQGRLLFPALAAISILWAGGWMRLVPARWHFLPSAALFMLAIWVPFRIIAPTYALPKTVSQMPASAQTLAATFGDAVQLLAYDTPILNIKPGQTVPVTLYWRGEEPLEIDYSVFIHILDQNELIVAQRDVYHGVGLYPTSQWEVGTQFADRYTIRIPRTAFAPARAHFAVGLYDKTSGARLPASTGGDTVTFGTINIQEVPGQFPNAQDLLFEDGIGLIGYTVDQQRVSPGSNLKLTLYWQSRDNPGDNYKVFVHLVADGDVRAAQHDSEPGNGKAPTTGWMPDQVIVDEHPLTVAADASPGVYRLVVGLYEENSGQRLRLLQDNDISVQANSVTLSTIRVTSP